MIRIGNRASDSNQPKTKLGKMVDEIVKNPDEKFYVFDKIRFLESERDGKTDKDVFWCSLEGMETNIFCIQSPEILGIGIKSFFDFSMNIGTDDNEFVSLVRISLVVNELNAITNGVTSYWFCIPESESDVKYKERFSSTALLGVGSFNYLTTCDSDHDNGLVARKVMNLHYQHCELAIEYIKESGLS